MTPKKTAKKRTPKNRNRTDEKIKYLVRTGQESFLIELPANWKVTFSSVNPNSGGKGYNDSYCLRVWEGEKLRAVFDKVIAFRDMSIHFAKEIRKETGSSKWESDSEGNFSKSTEVGVDRRLVTGDEVLIPDAEDLKDF